MLAGGEQQHLHAGDELLGLALPVEDDAGRADDEAGRGTFFLAQMLQPGKRLHRLAETHVVGQQGAQAEPRGVGEEVETRFLVRPQLGAQALGLGNLGHSLEIGDGLPQLLEDVATRLVRDERLKLFPRGRLRAGHL